MRGEFIGVWYETWREIWEDLSLHAAAPNDLFSELYRELTGVLKAAPTAQVLAGIVESPERSRHAFERTQPEDLVGEQGVVKFLESTQAILDDIGGDPLSNHYFNLLAAFIEKFSLRYDLRRPCILCPTLPGVFASLMHDLRIVTRQNANLDKLMNEFEEAVRDLRYGCSEGRIKTCIGKKFMLLEGMGALCPGVTQKSLGDMCNELDTWPHATVRESLKKLYGFASDYSGMRHGASDRGALRALDMRDMIAMCILLIGFTPYLTDHFDADVVYRGK
jgi:hypothetical protein